jgi:hypothetical protein
MKPKIPYTRNLTTLLIVFLWAISPMLAQQVKVSGKVTDPTGESVPGVNILEKGTNNGTVTNMDGDYEFTVSSSDAILVFSFIGFETQEVAVGGRSQIDVAFTEDAQQLDEVAEPLAVDSRLKSCALGSVASDQENGATPLLA